jgi:hypothetical protein
LLESFISIDISFLLGFSSFLMSFLLPVDLLPDGHCLQTIQAKTSETQNISMEKSRYLQDKGRSRIIWKHISKHRKERHC